MKLEDVKKLLPDSPEAKIYPLGFVYRYLIKKREEIVAFESIEMQKVQKIKKQVDDLAARTEADEVRFKGKTPVGEVEALQMDVDELQFDMTKKGLAFENMKQILSQTQYLIEDLIFKDGLVQAYNRYFYITHTQQLFEKAQQKHGMSLAYIDIDDFKHFNTIYGHEFGDAALQTLGDTVQSVIREEEGLNFIRMGGDEFILLEDGERTYDEFVKHLKKVQEGLRATEVRYHGKTSEISISIGVANVNKDKLTSPDELYRKVDTRLYEAKDSGKDRMVID